MSSSDPVWYFGYGSNMNRAVFLEERRMQPLATRPARLDDYRLCFNIPIGPGERAVANVEASPGGHTWGVLHLLSRSDLDRLDNSEGVPAGIYQHLPVRVWADGIEAISALTYQSSLIQPGRKPSVRYASLIIEGARAHGLPLDYVRWLESLELAIDERAGQPQPSSRDR